MKSIVFTLLLALCETGFGQHVPFAKLGSPFVQTNLDLIWSAHASDLPRKLWVYQILPSEVSPSVISNMVALGSFTDKDRRNVPNNPHIISYANPPAKKDLLIDTDWSFIDYEDSAANDMHITEGVPDEQRAFEMATNWLSKLGVDRNQLAKKPHGTDLQVHGGPVTTFLYKSDWSGPAFATNISARIVTFKRSLDGVEISGGSAHGGCNIQIGHNAKVGRILVSWRKYERNKRYSTATPKMLLKWVHDGKAVWYSPPNSPDLDWTSIKKIIITKATPFYYSDAYGMNTGSQSEMCPFAELEARVETGQTNAIIFLDCPIINLPHN